MMLNKIFGESHAKVKCIVVFILGIVLIVIGLIGMNVNAKTTGTSRKVTQHAYNLVCIYNGDGTLETENNEVFSVDLPLVKDAVFVGSFTDNGTKTVHDDQLIRICINYKEEGGFR